MPRLTVVPFGTFGGLPSGSDASDTARVAARKKRYNLDVQAESSYDAAHLFVTHIRSQPSCVFLFQPARRFSRSSLRENSSRSRQTIENMDRESKAGVGSPERLSLQATSNARLEVRPLRPLVSVYVWVLLCCCRRMNGTAQAVRRPHRKRPSPKCEDNQEAPIRKEERLLRGPLFVIAA